MNELNLEVGQEIWSIQLGDCGVYDKSAKLIYCRNVKDAIRYQFPEIQNLDVKMDKEGLVLIFFDETIYTQQQVQDFVNDLKNNAKTITT